MSAKLAPSISEAKYRRSLRFKTLAYLSRASRSLEARGASGTTLVLLFCIGATGLFQLLPNGLLIYGMLALVLFEFQKRLDQGLPLMQLAGILAVLQWTVGPYLSYDTGYVIDRYVMYVEEPDYFNFAIPGTAMFLLGLLAVGSSIRQKELMRGISRHGYLTIGIILNVAAFVAGFLADRMPGGLAFLFHLLSQIGYVGTVYFLFSNSSYRWPLIALSILPLIRTSTESAMFHDLILWLALMFCYWYSTKRHNTTGKLTLLAVVSVGLFTIQAIKQEYRAKIWQGEDASLTGHMINFWSEKKAGDEGVLANVVSRLNQGWIISAVMKNVPGSEPFAGGETFADAFYGAFVPRFLSPDKVKSGGQVNFRRFTGLELWEGTSMAISPLGEAYANFGRAGGILTAGVLGLIMSLSYTLCLRFTIKNPTFLFWIPLIFYQAIKAETESATVLNQLSKGAMVAFALHWLITRHLMPGFFPPRRAAIHRPGNRNAGCGMRPGVGDMKVPTTGTEAGSEVG